MTSQLGILFVVLLSGLVYEASALCPAPGTYYTLHSIAPITFDQAIELCAAIDCRVPELQCDDDVTEISTFIRQYEYDSDDYFWIGFHYAGPPPPKPIKNCLYLLGDGRAAQAYSRQCSPNVARVICQCTHQEEQSGPSPVESFCETAGGVVYDGPSKPSCFVMYTSKKNFAKSQDACRDVASSADGVSGRVAVLPTENSLDFVKNSFSDSFSSQNGQTWVALRAQVSGSADVADWGWVGNDNEQVAEHSYGKDAFSNNGNENCARYRGSKDDFADIACNKKFMRMCEFYSD